MAERVVIDRFYQDVVDEDGNPIPDFSTKGGEGSGNWGHQGLAGVWGGSSPTKGTGGSGGKRNVEAERFPGLVNMPLMHTEASDEIVEKGRAVYYSNWDAHPEISRLDASQKISQHDIYELGVVQAVIDKIEEKTGIDITGDIGRIVLVDSDEEMGLVDVYYLGEKGYFKKFSPYDNKWREITAVADVAKTAASNVMGLMSPESGNVALRQFDTITHIAKLTDGSTYRAEHVIAHELAHVLYYFALRKPYRPLDKNGGLSYDVPRMNWDSAYSKNQNFDRHTSYSKVSSSEGFAETFVSYLYNIDPASNIDSLPESFQVMDNIFEQVKKGKNE